MAALQALCALLSYMSVCECVSLSVDVPHVQLIAPLGRFGYHDLHILIHFLLYRGVHCLLQLVMECKHSTFWVWHCRGAQCWEDNAHEVR